jgi:hypothetical protein
MVGRMRRMVRRMVVVVGWWCMVFSLSVDMVVFI